MSIIDLAKEHHRAVNGAFDALHGGPRQYTSRPQPPVTMKRTTTAISEHSVSSAESIDSVEAEKKEAQKSRRASGV
jgi:hypothetical protein